MVATFWHWFKLALLYLHLNCNVEVSHVQYLCPFLVHGGVGWCAAVLPWEEGDTPWHQAWEPVTGSPWGAEDSRLRLVCPCPILKVSEPWTEPSIASYVCFTTKYCPFVCLRLHYHQIVQNHWSTNHLAASQITTCLCSYLEILYPA